MPLELIEGVQDNFLPLFESSSHKGIRKHWFQYTKNGHQPPLLFQGIIFSHFSSFIPKDPYEQRDDHVPRTSSPASRPLPRSTPLQSADVPAREIAVGTAKNA